MTKNIYTIYFKYNNIAHSYEILGLKITITNLRTFISTRNVSPIFKIDFLWVYFANTPSTFSEFFLNRDLFRGIPLYNILAQISGAKICSKGSSTCDSQEILEIFSKLTLRNCSLKYFTLKEKQKIPRNFGK